MWFCFVLLVVIEFIFRSEHYVFYNSILIFYSILYIRVEGCHISLRPKGWRSRKKTPFLYIELHFKKYTLFKYKFK